MHRCCRCNVMLTKQDHERTGRELQMLCMGCIETAEFEAVERDIEKQIGHGHVAPGLVHTFISHRQGRWPDGPHLESGWLGFRNIYAVPRRSW